MDRGAGGRHGSIGEGGAVQFAKGGTSPGQNRGHRMQNNADNVSLCVCAWVVATCPCQGRCSVRIHVTVVGPVWSFEWEFDMGLARVRHPADGR